MTDSFRLPLLAALVSMTIPVLAADSGAVRYTQQPGSTLVFTFTQLGAGTEGRFGRFDTELVYDERNLAASRLRVTVQIDSLDTQDAERNGVLLTSDLFDAQKHPTATFVATSFVRGSTGVEAVGKLTIRGVTRELRLPLAIKPQASGLELSGQTVIRRLEYGVGQGEWQSTESVGDEVKIRYQVKMARAG